MAKSTRALVRLAGVHGEEELIQLLSRRMPQEEEPPGGPRPRPGRPRTADGEEPKPDEPRPDGQQPRPMPRCRGRSPHKEVEMPPEMQKLIKPRTGFANYYFNELNRDRVWSAFTAKGDFASAGGTWKLTGELAGGGKVEDHARRRRQ